MNVCEQPFLGDPIDLADLGHRVLLQTVEDGLPFADDPVIFLVLAGEIMLGQREEGMLDFQRGARLPVFEADDPAILRVARNFAGGLDGVHQSHAFRDDAFLEQIEHERRGADLQRVGVLAHVRIADEQVEAAVFAVIGQRLVARVDDGAVELHPLVNVVDDVIGALGDLEMDRLIVAMLVEFERERDWPGPRGPRR